MMLRRGRYNIYISPEADDDLLHIADCIHKVSSSWVIADKYIDGIEKTINDLSKYGSLFANCTNESIVAKYGKFVKRVNYKKTTIIYTVSDCDIYILEVLFQHNVID